MFLADAVPYETVDVSGSPLQGFPLREVVDLEDVFRLLFFMNQTRS